MDTFSTKTMKQSMIFHVFNEEQITRLCDKHWDDINAWLK
jgi:hypothetical protein